MVTTLHRSPPDTGSDAATVPPDDAALVERAKRDRAAFGSLYDRYALAVYRYGYRLLGSHEAAEDATQTVFAKVLAALPGCRGESFRPWLFAIAYRVVVDEMRSRRPAQDLDAALGIADREPGPEESALVAETRDDVRALLAHLTDTQRQVVELRLAGLTAVEIGQVLGLTRNAVDAAQFRALGRLRAALKTGDDDA